MLTVDGAKMSKSLGNIHLISDLLVKYRPEALRYWLLSGHYRQPLDFSDTAMLQAKTTLDRVYAALAACSDVTAATEVGADAVMAALCDDLNTPMALAELNALAKDAQKAEGVQAKALAKARLLAAGELLGLLHMEPQVWFQGELQSDSDAARFDALIAERQSARSAKNYGRSDEIRKEFADAGVVIEDTAAGARWRRI